MAARTLLNKILAFLRVLTTFSSLTNKAVNLSDFKVILFCKLGTELVLGYISTESCAPYLDLIVSFTREYQPSADS